MTLPWMDADKSGPGRRKKPRGNLSKVMVRITINAGKSRILPIGNSCGKIMPQINASRKIKFGGGKKEQVERAIFVLPLKRQYFFSSENKQEKTDIENNYSSSGR